MSYTHLFDGKTWQVRQKVLRHVLVSDVGNERVPLNLFLFSFYHILDHGKRGRAAKFWDLQRLRSVDGQLRLVGTYSDEEHQTTLLFWTLSTYDEATHLVHASQFYEQYDRNGILQEKRLLQNTFVSLEHEEFEALATTVGFKVLALYGDYASAPFQEETSPFMIWVLEK